MPWSPVFPVCPRQTLPCLSPLYTFVIVSGEEVGGRQGEGSHEDSVGPAKTPERMVKTNIMKVEKNVIEIMQVILCVAHVCMCVRMPECVCTVHVCAHSCVCVNVGAHV